MLKNVCDEDWPATSLGKKLGKLEQALSCPICGEIFQNPQILNKCGHCFCCECISRHFDRKLNHTTSDKCPSCREEANLSTIKPLKLVSELISIFDSARSELLVASTFDDNFKKSNSNKGKQNFKLNPESIIKKRIPHMLFHGLTKDKMKKAILKVCENSSIKLYTDGNEDMLGSRYRNFIHLHNAQLDSKTPLSLDEVIVEINRREDEKKNGEKCMKKTADIVENLRNGLVSILLMIYSDNLIVLILNLGTSCG